MVRAKLRVDSIEGNNLKMSTVMDNSTEENRRFTKATPWGQLSFGIDNPEALKQFEVGKYYYADFSLAE
jgi:hypothetical protein